MVCRSWSGRGEVARERKRDASTELVVMSKLGSYGGKDSTPSSSSTSAWHHGCGADVKGAGAWQCTHIRPCGNWVWPDKLKCPHKLCGAAKPIGECAVGGLTPAQVAEEKEATQSDKVKELEDKLRDVQAEREAEARVVLNLQAEAVGMEQKIKSLNFQEDGLVEDGPASRFWACTLSRSGRPRSRSPPCAGGDDDQWHGRAHHRHEGGAVRVWCWPWRRRAGRRGWPRSRSRSRSRLELVGVGKHLGTMMRGPRKLLRLSIRRNRVWFGSGLGEVGRQREMT